MKKLLYILLLFTSFAYSQTRMKVLSVNCSNNTIIRDSIEVKQVVFESYMLPMSYNTQIIIHTIVGSGYIVSPSTLTSRRPKQGEQEPKVILMGCKNDFPNLKIGKFVNVEYRCND